ncbi:MAG: hypothetical protein LQ351_005490 [Letrouitia transgressa]|nr:MAG: hypothetical protein LQ351_005490 [Letrouitia transgressa]
MASGLLSPRFSLPPPQTFLFQLIISSAAVGLTKPTSLVRPAALPFVAVCVYDIVSTVHLHARPRWASIFGATSFAFLLQYVDLALLNRWNYVDHGTTSVTAEEPSCENKLASGEKSDKFSTVWKRFSFGWSSMWAFRHLNTRHETKNVPPFSTDDPEYIPPRWHFILKRTLMAAACYAVLDLAGARPPPKNKGSLFNPAIVPVFRRLGSITYGELKLRILSTTSFWVTLYSLLQGGQAAASAIAVGFGLSGVTDWRPAFGSLSDAYTLRNFWG